MKQLIWTRSYAFFSIAFFVSCTSFYSYADSGDASLQVAQEYYNLAQACSKEGKKENAVKYYLLALEKDPKNFDALLHMGNALRDLDRVEESVSYYRRALALNPDHLIALMELANTLTMLDQNIEALALYIKVLEVKADLPAALHNFAFILKKIGRCEDAIRVFKKLLEIKPDYALAHFNLSAAYLSIGDFENGWKEYEYRWHAYNESPKRFAQPLWDGSNLAGKTILVYAEQGLGDTYQFIRYLKPLKEQGACVIFESQAVLLPILKLCPYIDHVVHGKCTVPAFDYQIPLMTLPLLFKTQVDTIPQDIPYLYADQALVEHWAQELAHDTKLKIGICWHGNGRYPTQALRRSVAAKSIPLSQLIQIAAIDGVSVYSLQQIDGIDQLKQLDKSVQIHVFGEDFDSKNGKFMDTAAVMKNLDLVITVDTSIAHLAGGLGIKTWLILPEPADWRWIIGRLDSPWYPTMRIFKQQAPGDWMGVMQDLKQALTELVALHNTPRSTHRPLLITQAVGQARSAAPYNVGTSCSINIEPAQQNPTPSEATPSPEHTASKPALENMIVQRAQEALKKYR